MTEEQTYDVVIIGGGPAGLSAAQYAARARLKTVVLDKSSTAGALAFTNKIENYPGVPEAISGKELLDRFRRQAVDFGAEFVGDVQVVGVAITPEAKEVITMGKSYKGKTLIVATGSMGRKAAIEGEEEFLGRGVSYCAICDAAFYREKTVCVLGNSEEAAKEAGMLTRFASKVYLISPTGKLKVPDDYPSLEAGNLEVLLDRKVRSIKGTDSVESITMKDADGNESELDVAGVFVYMHGSKPIVDFLAGALDIRDDEAIVTGSMLQTSEDGVFAAGDVRGPGVRQVVIAASDGCQAALAAEQFIFNRKKTRSDWRH